MPPKKAASHPLPPPPSSVMVSVEELNFDDQNPRIAEDEESPHTQSELLLTLWRQFAVDEIALSIAANGYFPHEPLFAEKREGGGYTVIEGNRRLAAVKLLLDKEERQRVGATDLPTVSPARQTKLRSLPVIACKRKEIWQFIGFRHVNGPQAWRSFSKAKYIAWVKNDLGISLDDVATHIGDKHSTVQRLYLGYMALHQAEDAGVFDYDDRAKKHFSFSHLYTGLGYTGIRSFLGITDKKTISEKPVPKAKVKQLGELCEWLYGSKSKNKNPVVVSQNPDLRVLDEVVQSRDGIAALRKGLPLRISLEITRGDERLFREAMVGAKRSLQEARGKLLTGYKGELDLLDTSRDISTLADSVQEEMEQIRRKSTARKSAAKSAAKKSAARSSGPRRTSRSPRR